MSSMGTPEAPKPVQPAPRRPLELKVYGHTALFYWWPVWVIGYIMGIVTFTSPTIGIVAPKNFKTIEQLNDDSIKITKASGGTETLQGPHEHVHESKNLGVVFALVTLVVILITNVPLRGLSSAIAIVVILLIIVAFAYWEVWGTILDWLGRLRIHLNAGFYFFFSTMLCACWLLVFFLYDRLNYWRVTPGQITHEYVFGGGQKSYDTEGMAFEKLRDDLFRHWVLGFGSGDMIMYPLTSGGANREELQVHNVLFVGAKLGKIQDLIATKPEDAGR